MVLHIRRAGASRINTHQLYRHEVRAEMEGRAILADGEKSRREEGEGTECEQLMCGSFIVH